MQQTFGERLKEMRDERGMTREGLATVAGVHPYTVERLEENGHRRPERTTLERLAAALGVHAKDLWGKPLPAEECGPLTCLDCRMAMAKVRGVCHRCRTMQKKDVAEGKTTDRELVRTNRLAPSKGLFGKVKVNCSAWVIKGASLEREGETA